MKFFSQQGFSILQGLVLSALLAGSALVTSRLISDQKKAAISAKSKDATDEMMEILYNMLQYQDNCAATVIQNGATNLTGIANLNNGIYNAIKSPSDANLPPQLIIRNNTPYLQNNISISSMQIDYGTGNLAYLNPAVLIVNMRRNDSKDSNLRTKDGFGGKDLTRRMNLIIQRNEADLSFKSCFAARNIFEDVGADATINPNGNIDNVKRFCITLEPLYYWNDTTNTCELSNNACPKDYFFVGIDSTGKVARYDNIASGSIVVDSTGIGAAHCRQIRSAIQIRDFLYPIPGANCNGRSGVRWQKVGSNQVRITCN